MDTYEKKYKEAIERAIKHRNNDGLTLEQYETIDIIFPELKESKDERIRKALIKYHKSTIDIDGIKSEDILTWLEKQGEQKPVDTRYEVKAGDSLSVTNRTPVDFEHITTRKDFVSKVEPFRIKKGEWYVCIHDCCNKVIRVGEIIQAEHDDTIRGVGFLYMENKYFRPAFENEKPQADGFDAELNSLLKKYEHLPKEEIAEYLSFYLGVVQGEQKPTWEPSDEHIHWLKWAISRMPDTEIANEAEAVLEDLLEQLKKLREE